MCSDVFVNKAEVFPKGSTLSKLHRSPLFQSLHLHKMLATCSYPFICMLSGSPLVQNKMFIHFYFFLLTYRYNLEILKTIYI